jgi:hypothetical protein
MGLLVDSPNQDNTLPIFLAKSNSIERFKITTDGRGLSQFTAKGWAYWNGTGTVNLIGSHNVSSLTDQGTGNSYVIMTQAVVGNKCTLGSVSKSGGSASASNSATISTAESNPQDRMSCETYRGDGYTLRDATHVYIACFS